MSHYQPRFLYKQVSDRPESLEWSHLLSILSLSYNISLTRWRNIDFCLQFSVFEVSTSRLAAETVVPIILFPVLPVWLPGSTGSTQVYMDSSRVLIIGGAVKWHQNENCIPNNFFLYSMIIREPLTLLQKNGTWTCAVGSRYLQR